MDQAVRDFYRNFANANTRYCQPWPWPEYPGFNQHFTTLGQSFEGALGYDIARRNFAAQVVQLGSSDKNIVLFKPDPGFYHTYPTPYLDTQGLLEWPAQWSTVPTFCSNYPRPYSRGRRSYWTGAPRKRMNI